MPRSAMTYAPDGLAAGLDERSRRPKAERYDRTRARLADAALSHLPLGVAVLNSDLRLVYWNAHTAAMWGMPPLLAAEHPPLSQAIAALSHLSSGQRERIVAFCAEHVEHGDRVEPDSWLRLSSGRDWRLCVQICGIGRGLWMMLLSDGQPMFGSDRPARNGAGDALLDALTGLRNRRHLNQALQEAVMAGGVVGGPAVLIVDVMGMEAINANFGRPAGDALLCVVARRMERDLREDDTLARFAGDKFAILVPQGAAVLAPRLMNTLSQPFLVDGQIVDARFAIGVAEVAGCDGSVDRLLDQAMRALQGAKAEGANRWATSNDAATAGTRVEEEFRKS